MTEFSGGRKPATSEVLNAPEDLLRALSEDLDWSVSHLSLYRDRMREHNPQLAKQAGAWVYLIRKHITPRYGAYGAERAEGAFNTGNLMMYELLSRAAETRDKRLPDPKFLPDNIVDTEPPEDAEWLIDYSIRAAELPRRHPVLFNVAVEMLGRSLRMEASEIKQALFSAPARGVNDIDITHYLAGAAEIILPLERHAQALSLESGL